MATYGELEDLAEWLISTLGEIGAKLSALNGEEDASIREGIMTCGDNLEKCGLNIVHKINQLMVIKKEAEYEDG